MNYTTIEQSKTLVELGLNPDTADMFYSRKPTGKSEYNVFPDFKPEGRLEVFTKVDLPCWSLCALMNLLLPSIQTGEGMQNHYEIDIRKYWGNEENLYQIAYGNNRGLSEEWHDMINTGEKENLTDAAFEMVCWLLENGYIKKGE